MLIGLMGILLLRKLIYVPLRLVLWAIPYTMAHFSSITSESGVQQGDPLGPLLFCLVLHQVACAIAYDSDVPLCCFMSGILMMV